MENQLVKIVTESGLEQTKAQVLLTNFQNYFEIAAEWETKIDSLNVTDVSQVAEMKMAREARLFLAKKRIDVDKTRKQLGESALREKQTIDAIAKVLTNLIIPIEEKAEQIEKFKELKEAAELAQRTSERIELLMPFNVAVDSNFIGSMPDAAFQSFLTGLKVEKEQKEAAEKQAELDRIIKEKADAERKVRFEVRNKELSIYWATMPGKYSNVNYTDLLEGEYQIMLTDAKNAKLAEDEKQAEIKAENERLKKEAKEKEDSLEIERKKQVDEFAKQKADADAKLKAANDEKKRLEDEVKVKNKAEQDAIDKEIADQKARLKAEKEAAKAPDRERLNLWVDSMVIKGIGTENLNRESVQIANEIMTKFSTFKNWAKTQVTNL